MAIEPDSVPRDAVLVIGVGNPFRGDDGAGPYTAQQIKARNLPGVSVVEASGEGAALIEAWRGAHAVIVIDAVQSGARAGTIHHFDARVETLPGKFFHYSTHAFSVAEAIELARLLNELPAHLSVYGIEGQSFRAGTGMCGEVLQAAQLAAQNAAQEILALQKQFSGHGECFRPLG